MMQKGIDVVFQLVDRQSSRLIESFASRLHASRKSDFTQGEYLGKKDHLVTWEKPQRPEWMDEATYQSMPDELTVRETRIGGKTIISTFFDPKEVTRKEIGELYTGRWLIEVDLRFIKEVLKMGVLRCKTPEMVHKEIAVHLLAYNLIRTVMAQAAYKIKVSPRKISFKGTLQLLNAFRNKILLTSEEDLSKLYDQLLQSIARRRVGKRPGRCEPRLVKRRPKQYSLLTEPRQQVRNRLLALL